MDLTDLSSLYDLEAPVVTAYLETPSGVEDAAARLDIVWKDLIRELADRDVDEATRDAVEAAKNNADGAGDTRVLVAARGSVALNRSLRGPALASQVVVGELPHLLPLYGWLATRRPHLVVLADRAGAEISAYPATGEEPVETISAETAQWPIHKTGTGGWAALRFEHSVEESWDRSAKDVAALVERIADATAPALIIGSGDQRALTLLTEHLPSALAERFVAVPGGGRHADGSAEETARRVAEAVAERVARDELDVLERFAEARGRGEGAAEGLQAVVAALQRSQVDTLVLTRGFDDSDRRLGYGDGPTQVAVDDADLDAMGVDRQRHGPVVDVTLRAAVGSGAQVVVVSDDVEQAPAEGIGALLRFELEVL